jgi:hypothetical protein
MTIRQIRSKYRNQWILIGDVELDKDLEVMSGNVLWHSRHRDEVYDKALELRPKHPAFLYTGHITGDFALEMSDPVAILTFPCSGERVG